MIHMIQKQNMGSRRPGPHILILLLSKDVFNFVAIVKCCVCVARVFNTVSEPNRVCLYPSLHFYPVFLRVPYFLSPPPGYHTLIMTGTSMCVYLHLSKESKRRSQKRTKNCFIQIRILFLKIVLMM